MKASEDTRQRVRDELLSKRRERASLAEEVKRLREQLEQERVQTERAMRDYAERIQNERREGTRMQMKLMQGQLGESATDSEAELVKREVIDKTKEIMEAMREMREQQQAAFQQVKNLTNSMLRACAQPTSGATSFPAALSSVAGGGEMGGREGPLLLGAAAGLGSNHVLGLGRRRHSRSPGRGSASPVSISESLSGSRHPARSRSASLPGGRRPSPGRKRHVSPSASLSGIVSLGGNCGGYLQSSAPSLLGAGRNMRMTGTGCHGGGSGEARDWFWAMKANLEEFGDVEVFLSEAPQECMSCCQEIAMAYRVRPRRCDHVFHVECLLQWWTEGTCPVCRVSFAPEEATGSRTASATVGGTGGAAAAAGPVGRLASTAAGPSAKAAAGAL